MNLTPHKAATPSEWLAIPISPALAARIPGDWALVPVDTEQDRIKAVLAPKGAQ